MPDLRPDFAPGKGHDPHGRRRDRPRAKVLGVPVVCEKLDFSRRKQDLKYAGDARYARMLSSFAYSAFGAALESACARSGVVLVRVNPAYTSIIGRVKLASRLA